MFSHASARSAGQAGQQGRTVRAVAQTALVGLVAGGATIATMQIAQAVPVAPHNITIFPKRDFVSIEGYGGLNPAGKQATITVTRGGVQTSWASGALDASGGLEVNHPGGVCWKGVTPDIKPGDVVSVSIAGGGSDSSKTLSPQVLTFGETANDPAGLVVTGSRAADVPTGRIEQRIIAPDLKDTVVGRRDVRAPARTGPYTSQLRFPTATTFEATYHFVDDPSTVRNEGVEMRNIALAGQARVLGWEADGADGPLGLTIDEFGEAGGPGMGGCPTGPATMAPNAPTNVTWTAGDTWLGAAWSPATTMPDASPITGYRVTAVHKTTGVQTSIEVPLGATSGTVPGLVNGQMYDLQVRALSDAGASAPASVLNVSPVGVVQPPVGVAPMAPAVLSASPGQPGGTINATVNWTAPAQPAGVAIDGWRVTAYDMSTPTSPRVIKRVFVDETGAINPARTRQVSFATSGPVAFKVQAIAADEAGTLSPLSVATGTVQAR